MIDYKHSYMLRNVYLYSTYYILFTMSTLLNMGTMQKFREYIRQTEVR
jgi:hypothetical protein